MIKAYSYVLLGFLAICMAIFLIYKPNQTTQEKPFFTLENSLKINNISSKIYIDGDNLFVLTNKNKLLKLNDLGEIVDEFVLPYSNISENFIVENNILYGVNAFKNIFAYAFCDDEKLWEFGADKKLSAEILNTKNCIIIGSNDAYLYAINKNDGTLNFKYLASEAINDKALLCENTLFFGDCSGTLSAVDLLSGKLKVKEKISEHLPSSPKSLDDKILICDYEQTLYALDKNSLKKLWRADLKLNKIYTHNEKIWGLGDNLFLINPENAQVIEEISFDEEISEILILNETELLIVSDFGTLYIYDVANKKTLFKYKLGTDIYWLSMLKSRLYLLDEDDNIYIFKRNDGL